MEMDSLQVMKRIMGGSWYRVSEMMKFLQEVRRLNYLDVNCRQSILRKLNSLQYRAPFNEGIRFPDNEEFIGELHGEWGKHIEAFRYALGVEDMSLKHDPRMLDSYKVLLNFGKVFWSLTTKMLDDIAKGKGVFSQASFELTFNVRWYQNRYFALSSETFYGQYDGTLTQPSAPLDKTDNELKLR